MPTVFVFERRHAGLAKKRIRFTWWVWKNSQ
jgi:hypothetical protein